ncbi:MAG: single-stranded-DNA-specific exonuclease RecJ [Cyanobacteria bacterium SIG32]|nr:single-stranded-DNA-specific exonuclease RecJ [Cyanobacteria bacterium SIG32]
MIKEWRIKEDNSNEKSLVKRLLFSRGIKTEQEIYDFLHPLETKVSPPEVFSDMEKTVKRLSSAIDNNEKIIIYGDFDADGVTSTSLLYRTFKFLGADVNYFIPDRDKEGHGFDTKALVKIMTTVKPKVIISVDCGISDVDAVNFINSFKIDVIITDHHEAPEVLPNAYAIINPKAPNALVETLTTKEIESMTSLAGVGVAFKVAQGLLSYYNKIEFVYDILPYVAVGTISDIVPLVGENRYLVTKGLELISKGKHYGLKRLLESAGYSPEKGITSENIAFGVTPRINASGRLDTVEDAINLLISDNKQEIEKSIMSLNELNKVRQTLCQDTFLEADEMYKKEGNKNSAIILYKEGWHIGIIGIVAAKLVEKYHKPTFLMTYSDETKMYRCSARGVDGISLYEVISENSDLLDGFGGHTLAAGLYFSAEKSSFNDVKTALNKTIKEVLNGKELKPFIDIDLEVYPNDISVELVEEISQLEPFGASNPSPVFAMKNLKIKQKRLMGENKDHLRLTVQSGNYEFNCIRWQQGDIALVEGDMMDVAFHPQINEFNGNISVQLIVDDIHSEHLKDEEKEENIGVKLFDHRKKTNILPLVNDYVKNSKQNIMIFAESKAVKDSLAPFKFLSDKIFNRINLTSCDSLMFFDYPADKETFDRILEETSPASIHFMNYEIKNLCDKDFLTTFIKMLRFACNNNNGKVDLLRCCSALGLSYETILTLLDLFEEINFIKVFEKNEEFYFLELSEISDLSVVLSHEKYLEVKSLIEDCRNFQKNLLECDLTSLELV